MCLLIVVFLGGIMKLILVWLALDAYSIKSFDLTSRSFFGFMLMMMYMCVFFICFFVLNVCNLL